MWRSMADEPHNHHYVPQFYLRNFASDTARSKLRTVGKNGDHAVWAERSIEGIGFERDFYVHMEDGVPVSVETEINTRFETPISRSETWSKVTAGRSDLLDRTDKPLLYALVRHLEVRSPHFLAIQQELTRLAADDSSEVPFTDQERRHFAVLREEPNVAKALLNTMTADVNWSRGQYEGAGMYVMRSPIPLVTSSVPVITTSAPEHPGSENLPPGAVPHSLLLTLDPRTLVSLTIGAFSGAAFLNTEISVLTARALNRMYVANFAFFDSHRHLVAGREGLIDEMTWGPYDLVKDTPNKIVFRRRPANR